ncbi:lysin A [Mycobacterium phage Acolyte]|nr:lysin A [Mycobacterium phage Acolyte]
MGNRIVYGNSWSENGWPMVDEGSCTWVTVPGTSVSLEIQNGQPLAIMRAFAADFNAEVEPLRDPDSACWTLTNSVSTSNHLSGTAFDLNWNSHPFQVADAGFDPAKKAKVRELLDWYEGTIFWGNDWDSPKDAMHFQMGYDTYGNAHTADFINRKIRPDGFSTRRGDAPAVNGAQILSDLMGGTVSLDRYRQLLPAFQQCLKDCDCNSVLRIAMLGAQLGHESVGLKYMEEIASGAAYEGRTDLGNTQPGDGVRFKGRGPIQVTGRHNYTLLSQWAFDRDLVPSPTFFVDQPAQLASDRYGFVGVTWYWTTQRPMNDAADAMDIVRATQYVNGGQNGIDDRRARYNRALSMGDQLLTILTGDDELSADAEKKISEIHGALFNRVPSQSIYATPGEGTRWQLHELIKNDDGLIHVLYVEESARLGDLDSLGRVAKVAAGQGAVRDQVAIARATAVLASIEATNPEILKAFIARNGAK